MIPRLKTRAQTLQLRLWSFIKVPLLYQIKPVVEELREDGLVVSVPLIRKNRNHLDSMYFGVLACGADIAGGLLAAQKIRESGESVSLIFKDFKAEFLRRPESKTLFVCNEGLEIAGLVKKAVSSGKREELTLNIEAFCPEDSPEKPVARFRLTLSLKKRKPAAATGFGGLFSRFFPSLTG